MMRRRSLRRATAKTGIALLLVCSVTAAHAQVNGNATINAPSPVLGHPLSVSTSTKFAGAISSIKWANKEFVNNWDHGRQMAPNYQFFNRFECYNPYETGSIYDGNGPTSSSRLLSLSASGNRLESETQMAWYLAYRDSDIVTDYCGDPAQRLPCPPYNGPLSGYKVHKTVTIGFAGIPNVIEYLSELFIPEPIQQALNNVTAVVNYDFSSVRSYDVVSKDYRKIREGNGEDDRIKVVSTPDGSYALGFYSPELLQPYNHPGTVNWWFVVPPTMAFPDPTNPSVPDPNYACVHVGSVQRYDSFTGPGWHAQERSYLVVGNLDQVKTALGNVHLQFRALDPEVYNWHEYLAINGLGSALTTQEAARDHWLTQGLPQGLRGSKTFSASAYLQLNPDLNHFGATNYFAAIDHYVGAGRGEGRSTVAKPAAAMQHLLVATNKTVRAAGQNEFGQLGTSAAPSPPTHISSLDSQVTEVAAGDYTSFAVKNNGTLWVWGSNQYGARGDGSSGDNIASPVQVPIPNRITTPSRRGKHAVAVGAGVYAAVDTEGQVWTWGVNWNGRLGDGTSISRYTPGRVQKSAIPGDYLTGVVSIAAGGGTLAALDADGTVWTWGAGADGALGNGFTNDSSYPVQVFQTDWNNANRPLVGISEIACGSSGFCIALARYGTVFAWGNNEFSQLGRSGGSLSIATPIHIGPGLPIDAIAAGSAHAIAHSKDGNVYGWGYNGRGQLGTGFTSVAVSSPTVMQAGPNNMNDISDLSAAGNSSVMIRTSDRAVFVAGDNQSGQFGIPGNQSSQSLPVRSGF
jgi:alpha-tubulin suppressor-like RCC1 family protein